MELFFRTLKKCSINMVASINLCTGLGNIKAKQSDKLIESTRGLVHTFFWPCELTSVHSSVHCTMQWKVDCTWAAVATEFCWLIQ